MTDEGIFEENLGCFKVVSRGRNKAQAICPAHKDKQASLTITQGKKCTLFYCHAGCQLDDILAAAGLEKKNTFYDAEQGDTKWRAYVEGREGRKIEAAYDYVSVLDGAYCYTKIRLRGKKMLYGRLKDGKFLYGLGRNTPRKSFKGVYGDLTALNKAIAENKPVFIVEGEKDVNTLARQGYAAFTYGGANDWQSDFATLVQGAYVYILADNDTPGQRVAETIRNDIVSVARGSKIIVPVPDTPKADITDYFNAGHSKQEFEQMLQQEKNAVKEYVRQEAVKHDASMKTQGQRDSCKEDEVEEPDLSKFHFFNTSGIPTGVFHDAVFRHIKESCNLFVCGQTPYIYENGRFVPDMTGARLKSMIRSLIYPQFVKSTTINNIYGLFLQDISLEKKFDELNTYPESWICFKNGFWDCKKKRLLPHDPKYLAINQIPHVFAADRNFDGINIEKFLNFVCEKAEDREMLLEFIGYSMTHDTRQQKFFNPKWSRRDWKIYGCTTD